MNIKKEEAFLRKVKATISLYNLLKKGDKVVVGVSGGPDSIALLHLLYELREAYELSLHIAHLNHKLRGEASDEEERFVKEVAKGLHLPITTKRVEIRERCKDSGLSIEVQGRKERYLFFEEVATQLNAEKVALAHQADDVIETVIMDMIRGTGLCGLSGIPPIRKIGENIWVIRPLIRIHREEVEEYLRLKGVRYLVDLSNREPITLRNRIRHTLIPKFEEYNPNFRRAFLRSVEIWLRDESYLKRRALDALKKITIGRKKKEVVLKIEGLMEEEEALQYHILREAILSIRKSLEGFGFQHIESILNLAKEGLPHGRVDLPHRVKAEREYEKIRLYIDGKNNKKREFYRYFLNIPGKITIKDPPFTIVTEILSKEEIPLNKLKTPSTNSIAYIDYETVKEPLLIRPRMKGDWFRPLGMEGKKKIKDFFMDLKIPIEKRDKIPLLLDREGIIWVVGYRIAHPVRITKKTKKILKIEYKEGILE